MKIIHIDIDPARIGRTCTPDVAIVADAAEALAALLDELERTGEQAGEPQGRDAGSCARAWTASSRASRRRRRGSTPSAPSCPRTAS